MTNSAWVEIQVAHQALTEARARLIDLAAKATAAMRTAERAETLAASEEAADVAGRLATQAGWLAADVAKAAMGQGLEREVRARLGECDGQGCPIGCPQCDPQGARRPQQCDGGGCASGCHNCGGLL